MSQEKKSKLQNLSENLPVKARIFIGIMVLVSFGAIALTVLGLSSMGKDEGDAEKQVKKSSVNIGATSSVVDKAKVGESLNYSENSPKSEFVEEARKKKIEKAQNTDGGGYMDPVNINAPNLEKEAEVDLLDLLMAENRQEAYNGLERAEKQKPVTTGLDDLRNTNKDQKDRNRRLADMSAKANGANISRDQNTLPGTNYQYVNRYGGESVDAFMAEELSRAESLSNDIASQTEQYSATLGSYSTGGSISDLGKGESGPGVGADGESFGASSDPYLAPYLRDRREDAAPDFESMRMAQAMADREVEKRFGKSAFGGSNQDSDSSSAAPISMGGPTYQEQRIEAGEYQVAGKPIKSVGDFCYAQLNMPVNTDTPTPIKATILDYNCGKLRGAQLISEPQRVGETVSLEFSVMNYKGEAKPVSAIALDPESKAGVMADDVNRHIVSRYMSLAIAAGLPGWADSVRDTETRESDNGDETTRTSAVSGIEQVAIITGAISEAIIPAMQQNFSRPPTVKLNNGRPILVMFMDDIRVE
jgi:hypothetical protein